MTFQKFTLGLVAAFGLPWLLLIVVPFAKMRNVTTVSFDEAKDERTGVYAPSRAGRIANGSEAYGANGCYVCHSQVIRPTYAGSEIWRDDWAGQAKNADDKDTRRETNEFDYKGELIAHIGLTRVGPDLSNVGYRLEKRAAGLGLDPEEYIYTRLLSPRAEIGNHWSTCPSQPQLFSKVADYSQTDKAIEYVCCEDKDGNPITKKVIPGKSARALASYLLSLKKDDQVPSAINYGRN